MTDFSKDIQGSVAVLTNGGLILYPTDTIWGIGCDATNEQAVNKIFSLKQRAENKSMIILVSDLNNIARYVKHPDPEILNYLAKTSQPTTAIYKNGLNVAHGLINNDGTIAIRIVDDEFCTALIKTFGKPIVSTSANVSGKPSPKNFSEIDEAIKNGVDYIVQHRQVGFKDARPSAIIKLNDEKKIVILRP
ncbi:MAG: L-threonylcarbamoyladenylate synthase [Ginsengibacter sp.]